MISMIVCHSKDNRVIGKDNKIPWHVKEDFKQFKEYTMGKTILMGDNTFISIGKPLPGRKTIVATLNDFSYDHEDVIVTKDLFSILNKYKDSDDELVICGGATIYKLCMPYATKLRISILKKTYDGDTYFPYYDDNFVEIESIDYDEFTLKTFKRK